MHSKHPRKRTVIQLKWKMFSTLNSPEHFAFKTSWRTHRYIKKMMHLWYTSATIFVTESFVSLFRCSIHSFNDAYKIQHSEKWDRFSFLYKSFNGNCIFLSWAEFAFNLHKIVNNGQLYSIMCVCLCVHNKIYGSNMDFWMQMSPQIVCLLI